MNAGKTPSVIAIEEHYMDPEVEGRLGLWADAPYIRNRLADLGEMRIADMDAAGIDIQVLSHCPPGAQAFEAAEAATLVPIAYQHERRRTPYSWMYNLAFPEGHPRRALFRNGNRVVLT